jgi:uncharacterized membrane protein YdcZ (DUF606 family)
MTEWAYLALAFALGTGTAVQLQMIAAMGQALNPQSAAWISANGSYAGVAVALGFALIVGEGSGLPTPLDKTAVMAVAAILGIVLLFRLARSVPLYFAGTGLFATAGLIGSAFLVPRIGVAVVFAAFTLGTLSATLIVDHIGAFDSERRRVTTERVVGVGFVAAGTILMRTAG